MGNTILREEVILPGTCPNVRILRAVVLENLQNQLVVYSIIVKLKL
jgi:hypothetical protein